MINNINDLIKASDKFSMPDGKIKLKEKGRLEFKEILFGIGGGNASKFGIYKSKDGNYYEGYGLKKTTLQASILDEKFLAKRKNNTKQKSQTTSPIQTIPAG